MPKNDSTAVVTGGAGGIGTAISTRLAADGWRVAVLDVDEVRVREVAAKVPGAIPLVADITDPQSVEQALDSLDEVPGLVVNNAGIVRYGPLLELSLDEVMAPIKVNLVGTYLVATATARRLVAAGRGGSIVNITSMNGVAPGPNAGIYGSTKAAIALLTQQMAIEWGPHGIRVNAVAPGLVNGGMSSRTLSDPVVREARTSKVPLGRLGTPDDIAAMVAFLATDDAGYVTGQNLLVDGGVTMSVIAGLPRPKSVDRVGIKE